MDYKKLLLSTQGRIGRQQFWFAHLALIAVLLVFAAFFRGGVVMAVIGAVGCLAVTIPMIIVSIKRWHDRNKSGWWVLFAFVPVIGSIWVLVETGFLRGTEGSNNFGMSPLA